MEYIKLATLLFLAKPNLHLLLFVYILLGWHGYTFTLGVSFEVKKGPNFESLTCDTPPVSQLPLPEPTNLRLVRYVTHAATEACKKTKTNNIG